MRWVTAEFFNMLKTKRNRWIYPEGIGHAALGAEKKPGIYLIFEPDTKKIIYVGSSKLLRVRCSDHPIYKKMWNLGRPCIFIMKHTDNYLEIEKMFIRRFQPEFNIHGVRRNKNGKTLY